MEIPLQVAHIPLQEDETTSVLAIKSNYSTTGCDTYSSFRYLTLENFPIYELTHTHMNDNFMEIRQIAKVAQFRLASRIEPVDSL